MWARRGRFFSASAAISMMQATEDRRCLQPAILWWVRLSRQGSVALQRLMASLLVIVANIFIENFSQAGFVQHNQAIQAFPTDGADHSFDIGILPW